MSNEIIPIILCGGSGTQMRTAFDLSRINIISHLCGGIAAIGILIYGLISFQQEINNIVSSGFMMLLFLATGLRLFTLRPILITFVLLCQTAYFQWVTFQLIAEDALKLVPAMVVVYIVSVLAIVSLPFWLFRSSGKLSFQT